MKHDSQRSILNDKTDLRDKTAAKSFAEKLQILERIRERDASIRGATSKSPRTSGSSKQK